MIRRREFITLLGGAVAWPMAASAQQPERVRRVGVLMAFAETDMEVQARVAAFRQELRKSGWLEGANLRIDERWATDTMEHVHAYATELVKLKPDAILVGGRRAVSVLQQQTRSIPVVFAESPTRSRRVLWRAFDMRTSCRAFYQSDQP